MGNAKIDNRCPRCGGKIIIDRDYHGWYEQCLQCAFMRDLKVLYQKQAAGASTEKGRGGMSEIAGG